MKIIGYCLICWHDIKSNESYQKVSGGLVHLRCIMKKAFK